MIRTSAAIALAAVTLSLLVHVIGLTLTVQDRGQHPVEDMGTETVAMGNAFEDVAEAVSDPVEPETAPTPEPDVQTPPEPELAEVPTSEALVASADPQDVISPDTGAADTERPDATDPSDTEIVEPSDTIEAEAVKPPVAVQVAPEPVETSPEGEPEATEEAVSPPVAATAPAIAALTAPVTPDVPVTPSPEPTAVPVIPVEPDNSDTETAVAEEPENQDTETATDETGESALAVASSVRPQLPDARPTAAQRGEPDGATGPSIGEPTIESPLTVYQRDGIDVFANRSGGSQSSGLSFTGSGGAGNSDVSNYAGQVLVHLNKAPAVRVSARGAAKVVFRIKSDGSLDWVDVVDSTGSEEVERAAKTQVRNAAPFPVPPAGANRTMSFVYRIY